jgi:hypothetical protein
LQELVLTENQISGTFSHKLCCGFTSSDCSLDHNVLPVSHFPVFVVCVFVSFIAAGTLPEKFGDLQQLIKIDLSQNEFSGTIPESIGSLLYLSELNLSTCYLTGTDTLSDNGDDIHRISLRFVIVCWVLR